MKINETTIYKKKPALMKMIHKKLVKKVGEEKAGLAFRDADDLYTRFVREWSHIPEGEKLHTERSIFPLAAIYIAMQNAMTKEEAGKLIEEVVVEATVPIGKILDGITRLPGLASLFMKVFADMLDRSFGEKQGFQQRMYERGTKQLRFDITQCPYQKYYTLLGCPELCQYNCLSDEGCYGQMKKIRFTRTKTLGRGGDCCDFSLVRDNREGRT